jgi:hypothetical protein
MNNKLNFNISKKELSQIPLIIDSDLFFMGSPDHDVFIKVLKTNKTPYVIHGSNEELKKKLEDLLKSSIND